jgi:NADP-dependent 3-hydroxy acid dehydrogenase YdfG
MTRLESKVAWVVGGSSGIGAGIAHALAAAGASVIVSGRRVEALQSVVDAAAELPGNISAIALDASDEDAVTAVHEQLVAAHGVVDILVYSAGTNVLNRYWADTTPKDFAEVLDINLTGAMRTVHAVLPGMRAQGDGLIVAISSWAAFRFAPMVGAAYSTSKLALGALVETVNAQERLSGIRATHLCPGEVKTEILNLRPVVPTDEQQALMLTPEDIGEAVRYIAELPARICVNEFVITPTSNTSYL